MTDGYWIDPISAWPWTYEPATQTRRGRIRDANGVTIAHMGEIAKGDDARLMTHSPEILATLESLLEVFDDDDFPEARAAVAKARGAA